jgi:predicted DNA-binding WGR domain protein
MAAREFHFQDGSSNKFWTIELGANSYTVHFGRTGTAGQTQTKEFSSEAAARAAHDKLVTEKIKKGYKEVTGSQAGTPAPASAALETRAKPEETRKPAAKLAQEGRAVPLLSYVSKRMQKLFTEHPPYSRFAKLSIKEWLATCWNFKAFYQSGYVYRQTDQEIAQMVGSRTSGEWKKWSADQVNTAFAFLTLAEYSIGGDTGIVRRIQREDPAELAIAEALDQRLYWISIKLNELATGRMGCSWTGYDLAPRHHLLRALAVGDPHWAQRLADYDYSGTPEDLGDENRAILAAHRRDLGAIRAHLPRGRVDKYDQWRWDCLRGIAANDPAQVQAALQKELDRNRSSRAAMEEAGFGIVNLAVHGYYRLCQHVSPEVVARFDVHQSFPWDVEFHDWVEAHKNPLAGLDLSDISPVLHDALVLLKLPAWWTSSEKPRRPKDIGDVAMGPEAAAAYSFLGGLQSLLGGFFENVEEKSSDAAAESGPPPEYGLGSINDDMLPIAVNLADVEGALGSKDTALVKLLVEKFKDDIASDDQFIARELDDGVTPDEDEPEDDDNEDDDVDEASPQGIRDAMEEIKERVLKGESLEQALESLDENAALTEAHKDALRELFGSLGHALDRAAPELKEVVKNLKPGQVARLGVDLDEVGDDEDEADEEKGEPSSAVSIAEILRCLVMGKRPAGPVPYRFMYGCALRYLALHFGEELPHDQWNDFNSSAFRNIDSAMRTAGIPAKILSLDRLVYRGAPIAAIPKYQNGLAVGYLRGQEVDQALAALAAAKLDRVDDDQAVYIEDIQDWLRVCADSKRDLLCFSAH